MTDAGFAFYERLQHSKNVLLVKDDVGKPKACVRTLPNQDHAYGYKAKPDPEGAGALLSSWKEHVASRAPPRGAKTGKRPCKTDVRRTSLDGPHGIKNKPSTPIGKVVSNEYGNAAAVEKDQVYTSIHHSPNAAESPHVSAHRLPTEQPTAKPTAKPATVDQKPLFKLKRFAKVESRLDPQYKRPSKKN